MAIVEGQARYVYEALLMHSARRRVASRMYMSDNDASAPLHPLPRHHASRKKDIIKQTSVVRGDQGDERVQLELTIRIPISSPQTSYMHSTEQIPPLIVVTVTFVDISEL